MKELSFSSDAKHSYSFSVTLKGLLSRNESDKRKLSQSLARE
ncbi:hypothetical protein HanXRQr2_Chr05g0199591 [Helianthus annuus]|uniref:Uncharacterized protein n=1 Tax=Helianthus annuus TaxID=4232 RepID=A0A9K3IWS0_HELAN|nr:hypothetical protein HanXRQr2_Chr05g0199591 [Helianthus annuus]